MAEQEFPSNSFKSRNPQPERKQQSTERQVPKIVETKATRRKKSGFERFSARFLGDARTVTQFVVMDILIPGVRDMLANAGKEAIEGMIYPEGTRRRGSSRHGDGRHVPYERMSRNSGVGYRRDNDRSRMSHRARSSHDFDEIIFDKRVEAEEVLNHLDALIEQYGDATVANFYEMAGETPDYTDTKWGWTKLPGAGVDRVAGGGYVIDLPRPVPLD